MKKRYTTLWGTPIIDKDIIAMLEKKDEQKKQLDKNKTYLFDPFVGYIEKEA